MPARRPFVLLALTALAATLSTLALAAPRVWKDSSGRFEVEAELVSAGKDSVTLRRADGNEITVPRKRLSSADRAFLRENETPQPRRERKVRSATSGEAGDLQAMAERFFDDLRTKERAQATGLLTPAAQKLAEGGKSPLMGLPTPDKRTNAIRVRPAEVKRTVAAVPVVVRVNRQSTPTKLHFRKTEEGWAVFAISATLPGGEKTIDFEVDPGKADKVDPIAALVGKPMPITGMTLGGQPFDVRAYEGKVVLVDFWATWCGPCRAEMPNIAENYRKYHDRGFEVVAVSLDRDMQSLQEFVGEQRPPWVVLADRHPRNRASMSAKYRVGGIPAFALLGPDGTVVAAHCRGKRLGPAIEKALAEVDSGKANRTKSIGRADAPWGAFLAAAQTGEERKK